MAFTSISISIYLYIFLLVKEDTIVWNQDRVSGAISDIFKKYYLTLELNLAQISQNTHL